jgi:hypothetical protein
MPGSITDEWILVLLNILEVPGSVLNLEARYPDVIFLFPSRQMLDWSFKTGLDVFLPDTFQYSLLFHTV